jgi:predicted HTH domain antitoxin
MTIPIDLPEDIARDLAPNEDITRAVLEAIALEGYRSGKLTQAQVRRLLGYETRMEVDGFLKEHGIYLEYTEEDLKREAAVSDRLWKMRQEELARDAHQRQRAG